VLYFKNPVEGGIEPIWTGKIPIESYGNVPGSETRPPSISYSAVAGGWCVDR
jgi:hypothetical protein